MEILRQNFLHKLQRAVENRNDANYTIETTHFKPEIHIFLTVYILFCINVFNII